MIDCEKFLQEISPDSPCGEDLEYDPLFVKLVESGQTIPEKQMGDTVIPAQEPNWKEVKKSAVELMTRTKDIRVAIYLTRSLLSLDGLIGLKEGLGLIRGLLEKYWDTIHPQLDPDDDNDPTMRINILTSLCDQNTMLRCIREVPLVTSRTFGKISLKDYAIASGDLPPPANSEQLPVEMTSIDAAFMDCDLEGIQKVVSSMKEAIVHITAIEEDITAKVGASNAPNFSSLLKIMQEIDKILSNQLQRRGAENMATQNGNEEGNSETSSTSPQSSVPTGLISRREDVIFAIDKICDYYRKHEPSSPVPLLLKRAKRLVTKDFMEIIQDLAPDGMTQAEIIRGEEGS